MSYLKYLYSEDLMQNHVRYLKYVGGIPRERNGWRQKAKTPKPPPQHTAKSTKAQAAGRVGRNKAKCERYRAEGRREKHKMTRIQRDNKRANN